MGRCFLSSFTVVWCLYRMWRPLCSPMICVGGCFLLLWWGFLISGASEACRTLGLCTYHAFFSLLNVLFTAMGAVCGHCGRGTMGLCLICVAIVCLLITGAWLGFLVVSCMLLYQSIMHLPVALGGWEFWVGVFCRICEWPIDSLLHGLEADQWDVDYIREGSCPLWGVVGKCEVSVTNSAYVLTGKVCSSLRGIWLCPIFIFVLYDCSFGESQILLPWLVCEGFLCPCLVPW